MSIRPGGGASVDPGTYAPISATWATGTAYKTGELVINGTSLYKAVDDHTAGATFAGDSAHWTAVGGSTFAERSAWATATAYVVGDVVTQSGVRYLAKTAHTSGTFATDLAASKWIALDAAVGTLGLYGDGSDGAVSVSTSISLTRDMYYDTLTVTGAGTIDASQYRVFVKNTLQVDAGGRIHCDGIPGWSNGASASGRNNGNGTLGASAAGGASSTTVGSAGTASGSGSNAAGGAGGSGASGAGGAAGAAATTGVWHQTFRSLPWSLTGLLFNAAAIALVKAQGGSGGGGGGGDGTASGGGGAGGGVLVVSAQTIVNNGTISANGGAGAAAGGGNRGGGGGGGGGLLLVHTRSTPTGSGTITASGGAGGAAAGSGVAGSAGAAGVVVTLLGS